MVNHSVDAKQEAKAESALQKANHGDMQAFSKELSSMSPKELRDCAQRINRLSAKQEQNGADEHLPVVAINFDSEGHFAGTKVFKDGELTRYDEFGGKEQESTAKNSGPDMSSMPQSSESARPVPKKVDEAPAPEPLTQPVIELPPVFIYGTKPSKGT
ncbi:MAG TPA: hypothetical protein V6C86_25480 [Oculatellaceae cyanobacterium]